jgi:hypothetical protein
VTCQSGRARNERKKRPVWRDFLEMVRFENFERQRLEKKIGQALISDKA